MHSAPITKSDREPDPDRRAGRRVFNLELSLPALSTLRSRNRLPFLIRTNMNRAASLLTVSNTDFVSVAEKLGYSDPFISREFLSESMAFRPNFSEDCIDPLVVAIF